MLPTANHPRIVRRRLERRVARLSAEVSRLHEELRRERWNAALNCPRRSVIEAAWPSVPHAQMAVIFFDLDGLNEANYIHGYDGVNRRIAMIWEAIAAVYLRVDDLYGQWMGGDEFIVVVPHEAARVVAERLQVVARTVGLSASRAIVSAGPDLAATVARAAALVKAARGGARGEGQRGVLVVEAGL